MQRFVGQFEKVHTGYEEKCIQVSTELSNYLYTGEPLKSDRVVAVTSECSRRIEQTHQAGAREGPVVLW